MRVNQTRKPGDAGQNKRKPFCADAFFKSVKSIFAVVTTIRAHGLQVYDLAIN